MDETSLKMSEDEKTLFHWNPTSILQISKCIVRGNGPTHTQKKEDYKPCKKKKGFFEDLPAADARHDVCLNVRW